MVKQKRKPFAMKSALAILLGCSLAAAAIPAYAEEATALAGQTQETPETPQTPSPKPHESRFHHHHGHFRGGHIVKETAEMLGMEPMALVEQLKQGKTLLQVVQAQKGWSEEEYLKKLTETANRNIDQAVAEGKLDRDKADRIKAQLPEKLKKAINRSWKDRMPGHPAADYQNNQVKWKN